MSRIPFKTPVDYFKKILRGKYENINRFKTLLGNRWQEYDCDLHIYPWTKARPGMLSVGCPNQCPFCPTAHLHKGRIHFGDYERIIPQYVDECIHFMDENFFYNNMEVVLPLLKKYNIRWLAMSDYESIVRVLETFGEYYLYECGLRVIEVGLENIVLYKKVQKEIETQKIQIYYLNMTCLPEETKMSIKENAAWMEMSNKPIMNPIHFNNGCGMLVVSFCIHIKRWRRRVDILVESLQEFYQLLFPIPFLFKIILL